MATMLSFSVNSIKTLTSPFLNPNPSFPFPSTSTSISKPSSRTSFKPICSSIIIPSSSSSLQQQLNQQVYQPFRPPPSPLPQKYRNLDIPARFEILANRLGLWFEYAPLISSLIQEGFTPPTIEEATGISGVQQNCLVVGAQVRESLVQSGSDPEIVASFDTGGSELLYEIRLLSASQRAAAAAYIIENRFDAKEAQELARAMKDFPRRKVEKGWDKFDYSLPGDCLSFMYYRQSREHRNPSEQRTSALERALAVAVTETAKGAVLVELEGDASTAEGTEALDTDGIRVPVVRMKVGEVAEASSVSVLPVCRAEEREKDVVEAPWECKGVGDFGMVVAEKAWPRWVVLPGWKPLLDLGEGAVAVAFPDAKVLPWKVNRWYRGEAILAVVDRKRKVVEPNDSFHLVVHGLDMKIEKGLSLNGQGVEESLGTVMLVVRPPKEEMDDQLSDEEWD